MYNYTLNEINNTYNISYSKDTISIKNLIKIFKDNYKSNNNIFVYLKNNETMQNYNKMVTYLDDIFIIQQSYNHTNSIDLQLYINKFDNFNINKEKHDYMLTLILNGANINAIIFTSYDLYKIYSDSNGSFIDFLSKFGYNFENHSINYDLSPYHLAILGKKFRIIKKLIKVLDINCKNKNGINVLDYINKNKLYEYKKYLIENGALSSN